MQALERPGTGTPVVCVHGFCQSSAYWAPLLERLLAPGYAPDLPGFAGTAPLAGETTMEAYADALAAWLTTRAIDRAVLVGGSMGGVVAQHFALRHPGRVARLLLVATGAFTADPAGALAKADIMAASPWNLAAVTPVVDGFFHTRPPEDQVAQYRAIALSAGHATAVQAARANARSRTFERLGEIAVPVRIIQGRHDRARTPEHGGEMCRQLRQASLVVLENSGHTPQLEEPDAFWAAVKDFLS